MQIKVMTIMFFTGIICNIYGQCEHREDEVKSIQNIRKGLFLEEGCYNLAQKEDSCLRLRYIVNPGWENAFSIEVYIPYIEGKLAKRILIEYRERVIKYNIDDEVVFDKVTIERCQLETRMNDIENLIEKCEKLKAIVSPLDEKSGYISDGGDQFISIKDNKKNMSFVRVAGDPEYIEDELKLLFSKLYKLKKEFVPGNKNQ